MELKKIACQETNATVEQFWTAVDIWSRNPHIVNRRVLTSTEICTVGILGEYNVDEIVESVETLQLPGSLAGENNNEIYRETLLHTLSVQYVEPSRNQQLVTLQLTKLLPRVPSIFSPTVKLLIADKNANRAITLYKPLSLEKRSLGPSNAYCMQYDKNGCTSLSVHARTDRFDDPGIIWLQEKFFPHFIKWMKIETGNSLNAARSLSLVSVEKYAKLYGELKTKYGNEMVKIWPEVTDPKKFVYEDVAIAAYLLLLWEEERSQMKTEKLQSFVDLGCGNGLLVHILFREGHRGTGIDLRRRKIWDLFPLDTPLQVDTVVPSSATVFPGVDWIIGNHSDELTPWIPVIAARSSPFSRFFLLPCCPYEFDGRKYRRYSTSKSQYAEYIDYIKDVSDRCGFVTRIDKLRIPSTKRICLIGSQRTRESDELTEQRIREIISERTAITLNEEDDKDAWSCGFKPRATVERVRNCTQLEKTLITDIVNSVTRELLSDERRIPMEREPGKFWNAGGRLELRKLAESIPSDKLSRLRNECGGLQTLLKNNSHIFTVINGVVELRVPGRAVEKKKKTSLSVARIKVKPCWFHENHPDGCPTTALKCNYCHS